MTATAAIDMTGTRVGLLTVLRKGPSYKSPSGGSVRAQWWCQCDCGSPEVLVRGDQLRRRQSPSGTYREVRSCGCLGLHGQRILPEHMVVSHSLSGWQKWELVILQYGRCAGCGKNVGSQLTVHHDHTCCAGRDSCGKCIVALLCISCNALSARGMDDSLILNRMVVLGKGEAYILRKLAALADKAAAGIYLEVPQVHPQDRAMLPSHRESA